jgi:hypothetical protein
MDPLRLELAKSISARKPRARCEHFHLTTVTNFTWLMPFGMDRTIIFYGH